MDIHANPCFPPHLIKEISVCVLRVACYVSVECVECVECVACVVCVVCVACIACMYGTNAGVCPM
jgi:hypothetical protein